MVFLYILEISFLLLNCGHHRVAAMLYLENAVGFLVELNPKITDQSSARKILIVYREQLSQSVNKNPESRKLGSWEPHSWEFELESFKNREILGFTIEIHGKNRDF